MTTLAWVGVLAILVVWLRKIARDKPGMQERFSYSRLAEKAGIDLDESYSAKLEEARAYAAQVVKEKRDREAKCLNTTSN